MEGFGSDSNEVPAANLANTELFADSKNIKLKFTKHQYQQYVTACNIFTCIADHPNFNDFIKSVLGNDIDIRSIRKQLVNPIIQSTQKIANTEVKALFPKPQRATTNKNSYFTAPIPLTDTCNMLYNKVSQHLSFDLRHPIHEQVICVTDIRKILNVYFTKNNLKKPQGIEYDYFLQQITPNTFDNIKEQLITDKNILLIPKSNHKIIHAIVKELSQ